MVALVGGLVGEEDCHGRCRFVMSVVWVLLYVGCVGVWGGKGVGSGGGHHDSVDFFAAVAILRDVWGWRLGDL